MSIVLVPPAGKATFGFDPLNPVVVPVLPKHEFDFDSSGRRRIRLLEKLRNVNVSMNLAGSVLERYWTSENSGCVLSR